MGYKIYDIHEGRFGRKSEADEFFRAAEDARRAVEKMHDLACEMEERYSERYFGHRSEHQEGWDDDMYSDRRRRDSRGRYM